MRLSTPSGTALPRASFSATAGVSLAACGGLLLGAVVAAKPQLVLLAIGAVLALVGIAVAYTRPALTFGGLVALTALVPSYASPSVGPLLFIPAAAASWILAVALGWRNLLERGRVFKPNVVDLAVGIFVLLMAISTEFSPRIDFHEFVHVMFLWAGPYLGCRVLLAEVERPTRVLAISFGLMTAFLMPFAVAEYLGAGNVFHNFNFNAAEYNVWAGQAERFGQVRAEASFGHPIALSMFAATSAVLSVAMGLQAGERRERLLWYGSAALAIAVQVVSVSRTGWLILVIGLVAMALLYARGVARRRLITALAAGAAVLLLAAVLVPSALQILPGFEKQEAQVQSSTDYRSALLKRALEPGVLNAWGNAQNKVTPYVNFGTATDNQYILLADAWGLIPTAALFLCGLAMLWLLARWYSVDRDGLLMLPVVAFGNLVAIFYVAFITQQQVVIWLLVGAAGVAGERLASEGRARRSQRTAALARR